MQHSIFKQLKEIKHALNGYPDFVYSAKKDFPLNGIPVFLYHTFDAETFERHLIYLHENNYKTLTVNEFYDILMLKPSLASDRLVLLTADDARSSVWRFAFPLLKKYKMNLTVFIIPGVTQERQRCSANLDDYWSGKCMLADILKSDPDDNRLCNWMELKTMYDSGYVDIESHTLFHREVFDSTRIEDFITQSSSFIPYNFIGSGYYTAADIGKELAKENYLGLPIFSSSPLMLAGPKLNVSDELITRCKQIYRDSHVNNTANTDWKKEIISIVNDPVNKEKYFHEELDSQNDVREDLHLARKLIQEKISSKAGNHLCLPWTIGNSETIQICKEIGINSCFWGVLENTKINKAGDDPYFISRLKNDFIYRLPGKGRKSFFSIYKYKLKRRFSGEKVF